MPSQRIGHSGVSDLDLEGIVKSKLSSRCLQTLGDTSASPTQAPKRRSGPSCAELRELQVRSNSGRCQQMRHLIIVVLTVLALIVGVETFAAEPSYVTRIRPIFATATASAPSEVSEVTEPTIAAQGPLIWVVAQPRPRQSQARPTRCAVQEPVSFGESLHAGTSTPDDDQSRNSPVSPPLRSLCELDVSSDESKVTEIDFDQPDLQELVQELRERQRSRLERQILEAIQNRNPDLLRSLITRPICLENVNSDTFAALPCVHVVHRKCQHLCGSSRCTVCRDADANEAVDLDRTIEPLLRLFEANGWIAGAPAVTGFEADRHRLAAVASEATPESWLMERMRVFITIWRTEMLAAADYFDERAPATSKFSVEEFVRLVRLTFEDERPSFARSLFSPSDGDLPGPKLPLHAYLRRFAYVIFDRQQKKRLTMLRTVTRDNVRGFARYFFDLTVTTNVIRAMAEDVYFKRLQDPDDGSGLMVVFPRPFHDLSEHYSLLAASMKNMPWDGSPEAVGKFRTERMSTASAIGGRVRNLEFDYVDLV